MKLRDYQAQLDKWTDSEIKKAEKELQKMYSKNLQGVYSELNKLYMKYEEDGQLTYAEMMRYNRLEKFLNDLNKEFELLRKLKEAAIVGLFLAAFNHSYRYNSWALARERLVNTPLKQSLSEVAKEVLDKPFSGLTIAQRLKRNHSNLLYDIREKVTRLLINGSSFKQMGKAIKETLEKDLNKSIAVTRTETYRARSEAAYIQAEAVHDSGIRQTKEWISMKDERVRNTRNANHVKMDSVKVAMDDYFDLGGGKYTLAPHMSGYPEHDINCRCSLAFDSEPTEEQQNKELKDLDYESYIEITFSGDGFD